MLEPVNLIYLFILNQQRGLIAMGVEQDIRPYAVLPHVQPAIVEFYDWLLYEVSPSPLRAASVV